MSAIGSHPDSRHLANGPAKPVGLLPAQFRPSTENAPERLSYPAHAGEAEDDRVRAARRRTGPQLTAIVL
jgi:hypothetical protein